MKYPQYALGLVTGFCLAALYFMAPAILDSFKQPEAPQPVEPKSNFEVVDTYKGRCDVLKWGNGMLAEYKYCLLYTSPSPRDRS